VELVLHLTDEPARVFQAASQELGRPVLSLRTDDCAADAERLKAKGDAQDLLDRYIDSQAPATLAGMHRDLALRIKADWHRNGRVVRRLREAFQLALILLLLNILAWLFSIARLSG